MRSDEPASVTPDRPRRLAFLTGTRADFGKLKPLILSALDVPGIEITVVATGMHLLDLYGYTILEVRRLPAPIRVIEFENQVPGDPLDRVLLRTIEGLSAVFDEQEPDLFVVHGDRVEALAAASVGALRYVPVAHVEGGELSGNIDGVLRHAISKMSHLHLVANEDAAQRVLQLGEAAETIITIGSPDLDIMLSENLPSLASVRADYEIDFDEYAVVVFHSVTDEDAETVRAGAMALIDAVDAMPLPAVVIFPNNDPGSDQILSVYERLAGNPGFRVFASMRFEAFLTLLHNARVLIGNSSAGVREAPLYGLPSVNIGSRQRGRHRHATIIDVASDTTSIAAGITAALALGVTQPSEHFGDGRSGERFRALLAGEEIWALSADKSFRDLTIAND